MCWNIDMFFVDISGDFHYNCKHDTYYSDTVYRCSAYFWYDQFSSYRGCGWLVHLPEIIIIEEYYGSN